MSTLAQDIVIILGLLGLALWVGCFLLMLRYPLLERALGGLDRMYLLHHIVGGLAYLALLLHVLSAALPALLLADWQAAAATFNPFGQGWPQQAGWISLGLLMVMMLATFWLPLAYRHWRWLHLVVIPAFVLGLAHAWPLAGTASRATLLVLAVMSLVALGYLRALRKARVRARSFRVSAVRPLGAGLVDVELTPLQAGITWTPGQFVFAAFFEGPGWRGCGEQHPYTIAGGTQGVLRLLVRDLGRCTHHLQSVVQNVLVKVEGPYGGFLARRDSNRPQLWLAGGIGITPFLAALEREGPIDGPVVDLVHIHRAGDAAIQDCLPRPGPLLSGTKRMHAIESDGVAPNALWERIVGLVHDLRLRQVFLCGPVGLTGALRQRLIKAGVSPDDIFSERFDFR